MNKDQVKGAATDLGGKIQEEFGKLTGDKKQQAEGLKNQVKGKIQEKVGDLKEEIKEVRKG
ncbi:MAG: CsbD family protein [Candidatus Dechloromonas phosphoritropha]